MSIFVCNDCCNRETHVKVATAKEARISFIPVLFCMNCGGKMRLVYRYGESIDREELKRRLGLKSKLAKDTEGVWVGVDIPGDRVYLDVITRDTLATPESVGYRSLGRMTVVVRTSNPLVHDGDLDIVRRIRYKSSVHRVFVICPQCGCEIPAGRYHMHAGTKTCEQGDPSPETKRLMVHAAMNLAFDMSGELVRPKERVPIKMPLKILRDWVEDTYPGWVTDCFNRISGLDNDGRFEGQIKDVKPSLHEVESEQIVGAWDDITPETIEGKVL